MKKFIKKLQVFLFFLALWAFWPIKVLAADPTAPAFDICVTPVTSGASDCTGDGGGGGGYGYNEFYVGQEFDAVIRINTNGVNTTSGDVVLTYDSTYISLQDVTYPATGYDSEYYTETGTTTKTLKITRWYSTAGSSFANSSFQEFATVTFKVEEAMQADNYLGTGVGNIMNVDFTFTPPSTTDSNITRETTIVDILNAVENADWYFWDDNGDPAANNFSITDGQTGFTVESNITFHFVDSNATSGDETGVNTGTMQTELRKSSESYVDHSSWTTWSACSGLWGYNDCTGTINPSYTTTGNRNWDYDTTYYYRLSDGQDRASASQNTPGPNVMAEVIRSFTTERDTNAPTVTNNNPTSSNASTSSNITFQIRDIKTNGVHGTGVNTTPMRIDVVSASTGTHTYSCTDATVTCTAVTSNGLTYAYNVTINPASDFAQNETVTVTVRDAVDYATTGGVSTPNEMTDFSWSFVTTDTTAPSCWHHDPEPNSVNMKESDDIVFYCHDSGTGVDIDSISVLVNNVTYTRSGAHTFSYSGDSSEYKIWIDPSSDFPDDYAFEVVIDVEDLNNNAYRGSYGLATGTDCNTCTTCDPTPTILPTYTPYPTCGASTGNTAVTSGASTTETGTTCEATQVEVIKEVEKIVYTTYPSIGLNPQDLAALFLIKINQIFVESSEQIVEVYQNNIFAKGTAKPNTRLSLSVESDPVIVTAEVDGSGNWAADFSNRLPAGEHTIYGLALDENGQIQKRKLGRIRVMTVSMDSVASFGDLKNVISNTAHQKMSEAFGEGVVSTVETAATVGVPVAGSLMALLSPLASFLSSLLNFLTLAGAKAGDKVVLRLLQAVGLIPVGRPQGMVFDTRTYRGVPFAVISIYLIDPQTRKESIQETIVTDRSGIYQGIDLPPGNYRFQVNQPDYHFPSKVHRAAHFTSKDFYQGEIIQIAQSKNKEFFLIPVDPINVDREQYSLMSRMSIFFRRFTLKTSFLTTPFFIFSLFLVLFAPSFLNWIFFIIYMVMNFSKIQTNLRRPNITGVVSDLEGLPLSNTIVRLTVADKNELAGVSLSNQEGKFNFKVKKGVYYISAMKENYIPVGIPAMSLKQVDNRKLKQFIVMLMKNISS